MADPTGIRFVDVLTTGSAVANYLGAPDVTAGHLLSAIAILREEASLEDLGRPLSPMIRRREAGSDPEVRAFAQRWFAKLGEDPHAELGGDQVDEMLRELSSLAEQTVEPRVIDEERAR
jgi:hypothetical protein